MSTFHATILGLVLTAGAFPSFAETPAAPPVLPPDAPQPQLLLALSPDQSSSLSAAFPHEAISAALYQPPRPAEPARIVDKKFIFLNAINLGMAILDVEMTQRCIASHTCREGNPLMPASHGGQIAVASSLFSVQFGGSYKMKKSGMKSWWLPQAGGILTHAIGLASGLTHQ